MIATFNIQVFGKSKLSKPGVVDVLAQVVRQFDVVAIQEVRATEDDILPRFIAAINADGSRYDFDRIYTMARQASDRTVPLEAIRPSLADADPIVRYWAATGVVIRGADAVRAARTDLLRLLGDTEPGPRIAAAEGLARFGTESDRPRAIARLLMDGDPEKNGEFVALLAVYSLNQVPNLPADVRRAVQALPATPSDAGRQLRSREEYLPRLKEAIANDVR